jgi:hypothetical protein
VNITLILDATAIRAYARLETVSVGELLQTIAEDGDLVGIPVCALVDIWPDLSKEERGLVDSLIRRDRSPVEVLPVHAEMVPALAAHVRQLGFGPAQTVAAVQDLGATLATMTPAAYAHALDADDVIELS